MSVPRLHSGALVEVHRLGRRYGEQWALRDVDLTVIPGSVVAISGSSGAGKSTLLHLLAAYDTPDQGELSVDGITVSKLRGRPTDRYRRRVGVVLQRNHVLPGVSVLDNVLTPTLPFRRLDFDPLAFARDLLAAVGLEERAADPAGRLSPGEQLRVAIARALIWRPALLLADEPTGCLDSESSRGVVDLLLSLHRRFAMTLIVATHHHPVAARCDRIIRLGDGRVIDDHTVHRAKPAARTHALAAGESWIRRARAGSPSSLRPTDQAT
jgi:putative ABC transport system ATP-binding protein